MPRPSPGGRDGAGDGAGDGTGDGTGGAARIVVATPGHAGVVARLTELGLGNAWSVELVASQLASPGGHGWIALGATGGPCAFLLLRRAADEAEILALGTLPARRRTGHARRLVRHAIAAMAGRGVARLYLEVAENNTAAIGLYTETGFREVGRRRDYYRLADRSVDALVMSYCIASD